MKPEFDPEKFRELMLYIADRSREDRHFGPTKLAEILCYSDFLMYGYHGRAITGTIYRRYPRGPYPQELQEAERQLLEHALR